MFSFTFESYKNILTFETGSTISLYINDVLMFQRNIVGDSIVTSNGDIYVLPKFDSLKQQGLDYLKNEGKLADLFYYNHALTISEISSIYNGGYSKNMFKDPREMQKEKLHYQYYKLSLTDKTNKDYSYR